VNVLELFAGIGGLGLGLERAGMTVVGQVEIDPFCRRVLDRHWPEVPKHDDVRTAVGWWLGQLRPPVDVVTGGYPCQPESVAGRRRGTGDERWLWPDMARVIHALRPRYVIGENVMGHRTRGLRFVLRDLERLGYTARAGVVSAGEMGAPHRRQRVFVLAADAGRADGRGRGPAVAGDDGPARPVADAERQPGRARRSRDTAQGARGRDPRRGGVGADVADTESPRRRGRRAEGPPGVPGEARPDQRPEPAGGGWWATEPDVGRVAHGVPDRVDRLRALGNAVVPQVAEHVGRLLLSGEWADG
jgi:DNA (cytosine-5)-methyltransferase 1